MEISNEELIAGWRRFLQINPETAYRAQIESALSYLNDSEYRSDEEI